MATVSLYEPGVFRVKLDTVELETLTLYGRREEMCVTDAMADLVEYVLMTKSTEIVNEEDDARHAPDVCMGMVDLSLRWPDSGPYAVFNEDDKRFAASVLAMSLREALTVILYKRSFEGRPHGLERENEGMGAGESTVS